MFSKSFDILVIIFFCYYKKIINENLEFLFTGFSNNKNPSLKFWLKNLKKQSFKMRNLEF